MNIFNDKMNNTFINHQGRFENYYSLYILSNIGNETDFYALYIYINKINKPVRMVTYINYKLFEVMSPTLFAINADYCKPISNWYKEHKKRIWPNRFLYIESFYKRALKSEEILAKFIADIEGAYIEIKKQEIRIKLIMTTETKKRLKFIKGKMEKIWGVRRNLRNYIVIGYIYDQNFEFSEQEIITLNKLLPSKIILNKPKFYQLWTMEEFELVDLTEYRKRERIKEKELEKIKESQRLKELEKEKILNQVVHSSDSE